METPDIVITAGGTREYIDDVRYVSNFSSGRLGVTLANSHVDLGYRVVLVAPNSTAQRFDLNSAVDHLPFVSSEDLDCTLQSFGQGALAVFQAAAVADYIPDRASGKISSDSAELNVKMIRNKKILPELRDSFGEKTQIIGFKLLSHATEPELVRVAAKQIERARTDLCIANDIVHVGKTRKLHIVQPDGSCITTEGGLEKVASDISRHCLDIRGLIYAP